jgi:hypothetical protein
MARFIGIVVILVVLYAIVTAPQQAAATTRNGLSNLSDVGSSITVFLSSVVHNVAVSTGSTSSSSSSSSSTGVRYYPNGGVETGDGSTPIDR